MAEAEFPVAPPKRRRRWLSFLVPAALIGVLLLGPLIIWLLKHDEPTIERQQLRGTVVAGADATLSRQGRLAVRLDDGAIVEAEAEIFPEPGSAVIVVRTTRKGGGVRYAIEDE